MKVSLISMALLFLFSGWWLAQPANGVRATVVVNDSGDGSDAAPGDGICDAASQPGSQCTLRAAIQELNQLGPGLLAHRIQFDLAGAGPFVLTPATPYPAITVPLIIDGTSQPGARCPTAMAAASLSITLDGSNAGVDANGLVFAQSASASTVQGLVIGNFAGSGLVLRGNSNRVRCMHIGVASDGRSPLGNGQAGILVEGDFNTIGDFPAASNRNVIAANGGAGIFINTGRFNTVAGNYIGTTADGHTALANQGGIHVNGPHNTIGQLSNLTNSSAENRMPVSPANVVSGNHQFGIRVTASDTTITGNAIGVATGLRPLPNNGNGVELLGNVSNNTVGGDAEGEANLIAHNRSAGIAIAHGSDVTTTSNLLRGNAIYENGGPGIDIHSAAAQHTVSITGGFPVIISLHGQANTRYLVDVFRSPSCDPSGTGEGQHLVQTVPLATGEDGSGSLQLDLSAMTGPDDVISAQSTGPDGNSSEFSNCAAVGGVGRPIVTTGTTDD
jgi:hypothetical protein